MMPCTRENSLRSLELPDAFEDLSGVIRADLKVIVTALTERANERLLLSPRQSLRFQRAVERLDSRDQRNRGATHSRSALIPQRPWMPAGKEAGRDVRPTAQRLHSQGGAGRSAQIGVTRQSAGTRAQKSLFITGGRTPALSGAARSTRSGGLLCPPFLQLPNHGTAHPGCNGLRCGDPHAGPLWFAAPAGHEVRVVATEPALYFFDPAELGRVDGRVEPATADSPLYRDRNEWPKARYERGDEVLHISFRKWADALIVAPLDANTLAKFALGLSDNFLTCLFRAWDFTKPVVLAPAMNTLMWESSVTLRHLCQILEDHACSGDLGVWSLEGAPAAFARLAPGIVLIPPQAKRLACGDIGIGAMAEVTQIAEFVREWSEQAGALVNP